MKKKTQLRPTLGPEICQWIETFLVHGPGAVRGAPIELDWEFRAFIYRCYELYPKGHAREGQRVYYRAVFSRPKGRAKSELAAMLACAEALGPVRFGGWDENGDPIGVPVVDPVIKCFATEEGQASNTYEAVQFMLMNGYVCDYYDLDDIGITRTNLPDGGYLVAQSSKASSKDGGKETFCVFDEALALDTPLPTPTGWTTMGDVKPGDMLLGADGLPVEIIKTTEIQQDRHCYKVTFEDGTSIVASDGHQWMTRPMSAALPRVRTTGEMFADGRKFRVPAPAPWKLPEADLPVDPYLLGLWLGDGSTGQPNITVGDEHVPGEYFHCSIDQRTQLVRGLMDSDGHCAKSGHCSFSGNDQLSSDLLKLLRSLGQIATRRWAPDSRSRDGGGYVVNFTARGGFQPFSLPRKAARVQQHNRGPEWVTIKAIEQVDSVPVKCVGVASSDHLFLAGPAGTVTHNSHLWLLPTLKSLHATVTRNLEKSLNSWSLETTTMFAPGEDSVAEDTFKTAQKVNGVLFDHKQAPMDLDITDDVALKAGLTELFGPASSWKDFDVLIEHEFRDPQKRESDSRRYWLNQPWTVEEKFCTPAAWDALAEPDRIVEDGTRICLAFDGSLNNDTTALVGVTLEEKPFLFVVGCWQRTYDDPPDWVVDVLDVEACIRNAAQKYSVVELTADPARWQRTLQVMQGEGMTVTTFPQSDSRMSPATSGFGDLIATDGMSHDGDERLRAHVLNAILVNDNRGQRLRKDRKRSQYKIDLAVASLMGLDRAGELMNAPPTEFAHVFLPSDFEDKTETAEPTTRPPGMTTQEMPLGSYDNERFLTDRQRHELASIIKREQANA
jgi:phage terminase large subunit-like protein